MRQLPLGVRLRAGAQYATFFPGPNAEVLAQMQRSVVSPLWIWGGSGAGKSHLLQAACVAAGDTAAYISLAPASGVGPEILPGLDTRSLVCVDDVDAIAGNLAWERSLFGLFNAAAESSSRLILAAQAAPRACVWVLPDWASRAATAAVYRLRALDDGDRLAALRLRAQHYGLDLPVETAEYLLARMPRDLRRLFEALDALDEASLAAQRRLTVPFIREALKSADRQ
jgi:DnaA-homolog protein